MVSALAVAPALALRGQTQSSQGTGRSDWRGAGPSTPIRIHPEIHAADTALDTAASDETLLASIQAGDDAAFAALYDRHHRLAFAVAYRVLGEPSAAEDAVQDAFLAVWRRAASFDPARGPARAWLLAIVRHAAIDHHRRAPPLAAALDAAPPRGAVAHDAIGDAVAESSEAARLRDLLATLPCEQRQAIELAFFEGQTHAEIAARTGVPLGTVKGRLRLGLHKLRQSLASAED